MALKVIVHQLIKDDIVLDWLEDQYGEPSDNNLVYFIESMGGIGGRIYDDVFCTANYGDLKELAVVGSMHFT